MQVCQNIQACQTVHLDWGVPTFYIWCNTLSSQANLYSSCCMAPIFDKIKLNVNPFYLKKLTGNIWIVKAAEEAFGWNMAPFLALRMMLLWHVLKTPVSGSKWDTEDSLQTICCTLSLQGCSFKPATLSLPSLPACRCQACLFQTRDHVQDQ